MARILTAGHARDIGGHILGAHGAGGDGFGPDKVVNGDFSTGDLTGFTDTSVGTGSVDASTFSAVISTTDGSNFGRFQLDLTGLSVGENYLVKFTTVNDPLNLKCFVASPSSNLTGFGINFDPGESEVISTAQSTSASLTWQIAGNNAGTIGVDNISVRRIL